MDAVSTDISPSRTNLNLIQWLDSELVPAKLAQTGHFAEIREALRENGGDYAAACASVGTSLKESWNLSTLTALIEAGYDTYVKSGGQDVLLDAVIDGMVRKV